MSIEKPSDCEMSPLFVAIGTWYGPRDGAIDECLKIVEALIDKVIALLAAHA